MGDLRINEVDPFFLEEASQSSLPDYPLDAESFPVNDNTSSQINGNSYSESSVSSQPTKQQSLLAKGLNALAWATRGPAYLLISGIPVPVPQAPKNDLGYEVLGNPRVFACKFSASALGVGCNPTEPDVPDTPPDFPEDDDVSQVDDDSSSADDDTTPPCVPDKCDGVIEPHRIQGDQGVCISFSEDHDQVGLVSGRNHMGISGTDYNQDGLEDLFFLNSGASNQMFENTEGNFVDVTDSTGLGADGDSIDAAWNDYDSDGDLDLLLVGSNGSELYANNSGTFEPVPESEGIHDANSGRAASWLDNGALLLTENGTRFYRYEGGNQFTLATDDVHLDDPGDGSAIASADYDGDGLTDVYVANNTGVNRLFQNKGDGTYLSTEDAVGISLYENTGSTDAQWVQFIGESLPSLYVANWNGVNQLYQNNQNSTFTDVAASLSINDAGQTTTVAWGDFLNEGKPSLFLGRWQQNSLLYVPVYDKSGKVIDYYETAHPVEMDTIGMTIGSHWLDYDNDGDLDLVVVMKDGGEKLFTNNTSQVTLCPD